MTRCQPAHLGWHRSQGRFSVKMHLLFSWSKGHHHLLPLPLETRKRDDQASIWKRYATFCNSFSCKLPKKPKLNAIKLIYFQTLFLFSFPPNVETVDSFQDFNISAFMMQFDFEHRNDYRTHVAPTAHWISAKTDGEKHEVTERPGHNRFAEGRLLKMSASNSWLSGSPENTESYFSMWWHAK